jgi:peptidoglycan/LPS O-acetylase OafA/YrhL
VLYHASGSILSGGYVGVDVFFVISGFVITGVLLRERASSGRTSILAFYGRRCRRIIPAATLVIIVTIVLSYLSLGFLAGNRVAIDGRWAAGFLANFHFASEGTNYFAAQQLPSPLQNFWSLAVEEQFYLVYPTLFLLIAAIPYRVSLRARLTIALGLIIVGSFAWSVLQTSSDPTLAYFLPWTRAWELAIGALIAVGTTGLLRIPAHVAAVLTWLGLGAIVVSAISFNAHTAYPGSLVAIPVVGAALVIAGGVATPRLGAELLLGTAPFGWLGKLSYSLYLWHWPILIIAAESQGKTSLPIPQSLGFVAIALVASAISFRFVEDPIRHAKWPIRTRWASIALGVALIALTLSVSVVELNTHTSSTATQPSQTGIVPGTDADVRMLVTASTHIRRLPVNLTPSLEGASRNFGGPPGPCTPKTGRVRVPSCTFGDPLGTHTMVLFGDSHALMWFQAVDNIATRAHWRLVILGKDSCMANAYPPGSEAVSSLFKFCSEWQRIAVARIKLLDPDLVLVTQEVQSAPGNRPYTVAQWQRGLAETIAHMTGPRTHVVVLGNIPRADQDPPDCLAEHPTQVQLCSGTLPSYLTPYQRAERKAVTEAGGRYIDTTPWFCSHTCSAVVGHYQVYLDQLHVTETYSLFLEEVLAEKLQLSKTP